jgi:hypothetical protein
MLENLLLTSVGGEDSDGSIGSDEAETYRGERMNAGGKFDMIMRQATGTSAHSSPRSTR